MSSTLPTLNAEQTSEFVAKRWDDSIIPILEEYIRIPNVSPMFDKDWATNGHLDKVIELFTNWVKEQKIPGLQLEVARLEGRTPLIFITVDPSEAGYDRTVLMYGHLDKQPPLTESWAQGLAPYTPVIKDGKVGIVLISSLFSCASLIPVLNSNSSMVVVVRMMVMPSSLH